MSAFFTTQGVQVKISKTIDILKVKIESNEGEEHDKQKKSDQIYYIYLVLSNMLKNPEAWDSACQFTISHTGSNFLNSIERIHNNTQLDGIEIERLFSRCYRFSREMTFISDFYDNTSELYELTARIPYIIDTFNKNIQSSLIYISYMMPASIIEQRFRSEDFKSVLAIDETIKKAEIVNAELSTDLNNKIKNINELKETLAGIETGYNFVGLESGFRKLRGDKEKNITWHFFSLMFTAILMVVILGFSIWVNISHADMVNTSSVSGVISYYIPIFSIELLLLYFFRVILTGYKSSKAQLMQLELRSTLCQFIQSYVKYSSKIKKQDGLALDKFENIIFSGIQADIERIPSTFDGIEHLGNILKQLRAK